MNENLKAYLYPNPPLSGETLSNVWGEKFKMENQSFLELEFFNFEKGRYEIELLYPVRLKKRMRIVSSYTSTNFFHQDFNNPKLSEIEILITRKRNKNKITLPLFVHKISGRVKDFYGNAFPSYLWATKEDNVKFKSIVKTDPNGRFEFYYPEGKSLRLFIDDETYSKKTLECWIIANTLKSDLKLSPRVGNFELYNLHAWFTADLCYLSFIPASLPLIIKEKKFRWKKHFPPLLTKKEITVWINNKETEIKEVIGIPIYKKSYYPVYILVVKPLQKKLPSPTIIRVEINSQEKGNGEAWYVHYF